MHPATGTGMLTRQYDWIAAVFVWENLVKSSFSMCCALWGACCLAVWTAAPIDAAAPVKVTAGKAALSPDNTRLQFVCAHVGEKPDPRVGTFAKFSGTIEADAAAKTLKSLSLEFDVNSVATEFDKLTAHLKSPDFFDAREHPKASFTSKKITAGSVPGEFQVTGDLKLHGVTKEVTAPVKATFTDGGLTLSSEFSIDRSEFGMKFGLDKVEKKVSLTVVVGEQNKAFAEGKK
jgi:polyisoprenoid-binding protein YceI